MKRMHRCIGGAVAMSVLGAGPTFAQAFKLAIGGDASVQAGHVGGDRDGGRPSTDVRNRLRVNLLPSARADNGLEYGARIRLRASGNDRLTDADRAYIFAEGGFGQLRAGVHNSLSDDAYITAPVAFMDAGPFGNANPAAAWIRPPGPSAKGADAAGGFGNHTLVQTGTAPKLVYRTPRAGGVQGGLSYTARTDGSEPGASGFRDVVELNLTYRGTLGPVSLDATAGTMTGAAAAGGYRRLTAWQVAGQAGYAGLEVGGGVLSHGRSGQRTAAGTATLAQSERALSWTAGVQYAQGPLVVGANFQRDTDAGSPALAGSRSLALYTLGARYQLVRGLGIGLLYTRFDAGSEQGGDRDGGGNVLLLHTTLTF